MTNNEKLALLNEFRAVEGLASYKDWRPARHQSQLDVYVATAEAKAKVSADKVPSYKEFARYEKSAVDRPVDFVHKFLSEHLELSRKQAVHALVSDHGVNYSTARTQYQKWFAARKA